MSLPLLSMCILPPRRRPAFKFHFGLMTEQAMSWFEWGCMVSLGPQAIINLRKPTKEHSVLCRSACSTGER